MVAESEPIFYLNQKEEGLFFDLVIKRPAIDFSSSELDKTISAISPVNF